eukprot:Nitzschia sp. Nitz4//scaffold30_size153850//29989//31260//NITZ4_002764-RA/size153850-processed-gene-0.35-mRNA-1//-1//CDS//3329547220//615//frame0
MDQTTVLLALARFTSAIARLCLGPLLPMLSVALEFEESAKPALLSAYNSGYILTQIGGGVLADKYGFSVIISGAVGLSAVVLFYVATMATTVSEWTRAFFLMGTIAGPLFPAGSSAISANVKPESRAASAAIVDAAASAGTCVAAMAPMIASTFGWRFVYHMAASGLALVAVAVWVTFPTKPSIQAQKTNSHKGLPDTPHEKIATPDRATCQNYSEPKPPRQGSMVVLLQPALVATYFCHSIDNISKYTINAYAATMLVSKHQSSPVWVGVILGSQEAVGVCSKVLVGTILSSVAPTFYNRGRASAIGFFVQGIFLCATFFSSTDVYAGACLILAALAVGSHSIGFRPVYVEASPDHAGSVSGVGNTVASFASVMGLMTVGTLVQNAGGDWAVVALLLLVINFIGCLAALTIACLGGGQRKES